MNKVEIRNQKTFSYLLGLRVCIVEAPNEPEHIRIQFEGKRLIVEKSESYEGYVLCREVTSIHEFKKFSPAFPIVLELIID